MRLSSDKKHNSIWLLTWYCYKKCKRERLWNRKAIDLNTSVYCILENVDLLIHTQFQINTHYHFNKQKCSKSAQHHKQSNNTEFLFFLFSVYFNSFYFVLFILYFYIFLLFLPKYLMIIQLWRFQTIAQLTSSIIMNGVG